MTTKQADVKYMNERLHFITSSFYQAYNLYCFLSEQDKVSDQQYKTLLEHYTITDTAIRDYYKYLDEVNVPREDSYLTRLLDKEDMGDQLIEIEYYLEEIKR